MSLTEEDKQWISEQINASTRHFAELVAEMTASFSAEVQDLRTDVTERFDAQAARLDRQGALWQTGSRWSARMDAWAEKVDANAEAAQKDLAEIRRRLAEVEKLLKKQS